MKEHLDLFSGIGGFALAAKWAEIETVAFVEIDKFCQKILKNNFNNIPIFDDIRDFDGKEFYGVDLITGGYPCQPFSVAGKRKGKNDSRHLWPEMLRIIKEAKPKYVISENVKGHITCGLDEVLNDLETAGYASETYCIPALSVGANHARERVYTISYPSSNGCDEGKISRSTESTDEYCAKREKENFSDERCRSLWTELERTGSPHWSWRTEPPAYRVDDGLPNRMERNKSIGNSIVPQIAYFLIRTIMI